MDYLLKASAILGIFYLFYKLILQKETFFQSNRLFLLIGIIASLLLPLLVIPIYIEQTSNVINNFIIAEGNTLNEIQKTIDWQQIILLIYFSGVIFFSGKILISLISLFKLLITSSKEKVEGFYFIKTHSNESPFSFFNYIVYNQNLFESKELQQILTHEKVHGYQWHSFDVLLSQVATIIFWFNPFSWLYKKELQQNLEFIADAISQETTACKKTYQQLLLKTSISKNQLALTNNFYNSLIKKRILMLHKNKSKKRNQWKFALIFPLIIAFIFTFNTKVIAQDSTEKEHKTHVIEENVQMVIITKGASDESLEKIKNNFLKDGITINFKGIKRNSNDEITHLTIKVSDKNGKVSASWGSEDKAIPNIMIGRVNGQLISSTVNPNNNSINFISNNNTTHTKGEGSQPFILISNVDNLKEMHEAIITNEVNTGSTEDIDNMTSNDKGSPIYFIDGEKVTEKDLDKLDANKIEKITVLKGNDAVKKYGEKAKDGVVEIYKIKGVDNHQLIEIKTDGSNGKTIWVTKKENKTIEIIGDEEENIIFISEDKNSPIYFIDGIESTKEDVDKLGSNKIEKITVLKGDSAIEKYGKKAKGGVVETTTKKK